MNLVLISFLILMMGLTSSASSLVEMPKGRYRPLMAETGKEVDVAKFEVEATAVTNIDFLNFVKNNPQWRKTKAKKIFVDDRYLSHWKSDLELGPIAKKNAPVIFVSWFAAQAYCQSLGMNLPSVDQWEYMGRYGPADNSKDVKTVILEWYSKPTPEITPDIKTTFKNRFGVWDLHGLIWEWTFDFNTTFVTGESRGDSALEKSLYCGSGALGSADPSDYAAFMRFGFRSSLKANYTLANLGFRCVKGELL